MLRIILIIVISYIVIRITLRLLLTESPSQRRARMYSEQNRDSRKQTGTGYGTVNNPGSGRRFDHIEDAEFEEIPPKSRKEEKRSQK